MVYRPFCAGGVRLIPHFIYNSISDILQGILLLMIEMQCVISGKVQNVAYRAYVQDAADELALTGWVQNANDGTVLVCAQGQPTVLKEFVEYLHEGSLLAEVEAVSVEWGSVQQVFDDFSIKH